MTNELAIPEANKAIKQIKEINKTLDKLSKVLNESELDQLCEVTNTLLKAERQITKIRGWF